MPAGTAARGTGGQRRGRGAAVYKVYTVRLGCQNANANDPFSGEVLYLYLDFGVFLSLHCCWFNGDFFFSI